MPILLSLREFAAWIAAVGVSQKSDVSLIWGFILQDLRERNLSFAAEHLKDALTGGEILLLMDGLDEVPAPILPAVRGSIVDCASRYPDGRYLVTCRELAYQQPQRQLPEEHFPVTTLAPFDSNQIDRFIGAWYAEISGKGRIAAALASERADRLRRAVRRPDLRALASNPMLLTVMSLVHAHRGELPDSRSCLYEESLGILLWHWEQHGARGEARLTELLREAERDRGDLISLLERLAYEVCPKGGAAPPARSGESNALPGIGEQELIEVLRNLHPKRHLDWAQNVSDLLRLRAGLLVEVQPGAVCFLHRTFQEYLAGTYLAHSSSFPERVSELLQDWAAWRDTILFGVGFLVHCQREIERPLALAQRLCPMHPPEDDSEWRGIWLAGEVLLEIGLSRVRDSEAGARILEQVRHRLGALIECGALRARERAEAGDVLGRIGDGRFDRTRFHLPTGFRGEREARGETGRRYAWGDEWDDSRANVSESVEHASTVGMYPKGASPNGVMDLTGNVWEWCLTGWKDYPYRPDDGRNDPQASGARVLRGGSWLQDRRCARCAYRLESFPDSDGRDIGFRLVLSRSSGAF